MRSILLLPLALLLSSYQSSVLAQTPTLEFAAGQGNTTGSGPTIDEQVITFQNNPNNPNDDAFVAYSPINTVAYTLGNQQYGSGTTNPGVVFGGSTSTTGVSTPDASTLFQPMGSTNAAATYYTSASGVSGGISATSKYALQVLVNANYTKPLTANTSYQYADLTLTFNQAVSNPVLQIVGLGARSGSGATAVGYTTDLTMLTSGVTLSLLSGSTEMQVSGTQIRNSASTFSTTTNSGAASGSVLVTTPAGGITSLQLRLTLRVGANGGAPTQNGGAGGDGFLLGVSRRTPTPLPATLVDFTAQATGTTVDLRWNTAAELHNDYFAVERSLDGAHFQTLGQVQGIGKQSSNANYAFADRSAPAQSLVYYRLRQVDLDGTSSYSPMRTVQVAAPATVAISVAPNPATTEVALNLTQLPADTYQLRVFDSCGREVLHREVMGSQTYQLMVAALPSGVYSVAVQNDDQRVYTRFCKE